MNHLISLTPDFSPVMTSKEDQNRFNGFSRAGKPLKRLIRSSGRAIRLKPGVNENPHFAALFYDLNQ